MSSCEWTQCVDPPYPRTANNGGLKSDWNGANVYEFGSHATYTCNSTDTYFDTDREMASFELECLEGGRWELPTPTWPLCVKGTIN